MIVARTATCLLIVPSLILSTAQPTLADVIYVNLNASGLNEGSSWENAYVDLQDALATAIAGDEIWVASGTYKPTTETDPSATFQLLSGVGLYGGFTGTETARDGRDWVANETILSGNLPQGNSNHVVTGSGTDDTALLDGFTVRDGYGDNLGGGGMLIDAGSPTIRNVRFCFCFGISPGGGGIAVLNGSAPNFAGVHFADNEGIDYGGGMYCNASRVLVESAVFERNLSNEGGALFMQNSHATLRDVVFEDNFAADGGGGIYATSSTLFCDRYRFD